MQIGIMAKTFSPPTLAGTLDAVAAHGLSCMQYNLTCTGLPDMPDEIDPEICDRIREEIAARGMTMSAISGTYNMIHPDIQERENGLRKLGVLASVCHRLGTSVISLCTGTRDPGSMWRSHPDNDLPDAWDDIVTEMRKALKIAAEYDVVLAFEPEVSNVIDSAVKARRILDEMQSPHLKIVMDPANIFHKGELPRMREIIDEAFELLGQDIAFGHAKDLDRDGAAGHLAAGKGLLDYHQYLSLISKVDFDVPLILHGLSEAEVDGCVDFLKSVMKEIEN